MEADFMADRQGNFKAGRYIGLCYENGYGVQPDMVKAVEWYQKAADAGDITGTCCLGHMALCFPRGSRIKCL